MNPSSTYRIFIVEDDPLYMEPKLKPDNVLTNSKSGGTVIDWKEKKLLDHIIQLIKSYLKKYNNVLLVAQKLDVGKSTIYKMTQDNELSLS